MAIGMQEATNPLAPEVVDLVFSSAFVVHTLSAATVLALSLVFAKRTRLSLVQMLALFIPLIGPLALAAILCSKLRTTSIARKRS